MVCLFSNCLSGSVVCLSFFVSLCPCLSVCLSVSLCLRICLSMSQYRRQNDKHKRTHSQERQNKPDGKIAIHQISGLQCWCFPVLRHICWEVSQRPWRPLPAACTCGTHPVLRQGEVRADNKGKEHNNIRVSACCVSHYADWHRVKWGPIRKARNSTTFVCQHDVLAYIMLIPSSRNSCRVIDRGILCQ